MSMLPLLEWEVLRDTDLVEAMLDIIPHPIFFKDMDGRYLGCNRHFCDMLGLSREELIGRSVFEVAPSELAQVYHDADIRLMGEGGTQRYTASVRFADGIARRGVFFKSVFRDRSGNKTGLVGMFYPMEFLLDILDT